MKDEAELIRDCLEAEVRAKLAEQDRDKLARLEKTLAERQAKLDAALNQQAFKSSDGYTFPYEGSLGRVAPYKVDSRTAKLNYLHGVLEAVCNLYNPDQELAKLRDKLLAQVLTHFEEEK